MEFTALTKQQRQAFDRNGFLLIPDALPAAMVSRLLEVVDRLHDEGVRRDGLNERGFWQMRNCLPNDDLFLELLDWPATVPLIVQLLSHNIQLITSHLVVRPPVPAVTDSSYKQVGWHRDGGTAPSDLGLAQPRMFIKVAYWLTDLSETGRGAIRLLPGSNDTSISAPIPANGSPRDGGEESLELRVTPGTAVLFENRTLHAVGPNLSEMTRKSLFFGYGYRWLRPMDYLTMPDQLIRRCDPIRRQLLGDCTSPMGFQLPEADDVPLRVWLAEQAGEVPESRLETPGAFTAGD
jgi:ectoine hydroxylase